MQPGERVAIVGPSGSGKSTLVDLLYRPPAPSGGHVEIDGVNLRDLRLDALRERVAVVKGLEVIEGTVLENVRVGRREIPLGEVRRALDAVGLLEDLSALPDGLHTRLAAGGRRSRSARRAARCWPGRSSGGPACWCSTSRWTASTSTRGRRTRESLFDRSAPWTLLVVTHAQEVAAQLRPGGGPLGGKADRSTAMANGHSPNLEDLLKEGR